MDDTNKTNQPLDSSALPGSLPFTPPISSVPTMEDITPTAEPSVAPTVNTTTPISTVATPTIEPLPKTEWDLPEPTPVASAPEPTITSTVPAPDPEPIMATPQITPPVLDVAPLPTPTPTEPTIPTEKPKSKISPIIGGIVALLFVVGVAGAAYYVSNQLSTRQAVAPTAPESEPMAAASCSAKSGHCTGEQICDTRKNTMEKLDCGGVLQCCYPKPTALPATQTAATTTTCQCIPGKTEICTLDAGRTSGTRKCISLGIAGNASCGTWDSCKPATQTAATTTPTGSSNDSAGGSGSNNCAVQCGNPAGTQTNCTTANVQNATCRQCCCGDKAITCNGKWKCGTSCPEIVIACDTTERQLTKEKTITFENAGKIMAFSKSFTGTITLTPTSGTALVFNSADGGAAVQLPESFNVSAGSTYTVSIKRNGTAEAYGWQPPKAANTCGPMVASCGGDADIKALVDLAKSKATLTGIKTAAIDSSIQCWGDILAGDATQDYDYNDYAFVFGYEGVTVGACTEIKVYKKVNGVYGTTALTTTQLGSLTVGDVLKFALTSNTDNLKGRFKVTVGATSGSWLTGTIDATNKKLVTYSDYKVTSAGTYKFEAQVSTTP